MSICTCLRAANYGSFADRCQGGERIQSLVGCLFALLEPGINTGRKQLWAGESSRNRRVSWPAYGSAGNLKAEKVPWWERGGLDCIQHRIERSTEWGGRSDT